MTYDWIMEISGVTLRFPDPLLKNWSAGSSETSVSVHETACQPKGHAENRIRHLNLLTFRQVCHKVTIQ